MENIKCIFCNEESNTVIIKENNYFGRKCQNCNLIYINPRPALEEIVDLYGHDNANISAKSHIKNKFTKTLYAKHNLKIINRYIKRGKILEIGAGAGYFLNEARKKYFDVYGIEFNEAQANFINKELNIPCEQSSLNVNSFNDEKFDLIYHCDVISHFYNPLTEFEKIKLKLKENGLVIFETGNIGDVDIKYFKYFTKFQYPDHLFFFSEKNIETLLEKTGFELIKIHRFSILPQLFIIKIIKTLINYTLSIIKVNNTHKSNTNRIAKINENYFKQLLKNIYSYTLYQIRYKLGMIMPKKARPQTMIVIARRK